MGKQLSALRDVESRESLDFTHNIISTKLELYQTQTEAEISDPNSSLNRNVPVIHHLKWEREIYVDVLDEGSQQISGAVDRVFGTGNPDVMNGFKERVKASLGPFFGNVEAGEHVDKKFFLLVQYGFLVRLDVTLWRYNFGSKNVLGNRENLFGGLLCLTLVDHKALQRNDLIYLLSEGSVGDDVVDKKYINEVVSLYDRKIND